MITHYKTTKYVALGVSCLLLAGITACAPKLMQKHPRQERAPVKLVGYTLQEALFNITVARLGIPVRSVAFSPSVKTVAVVTRSGTWLYDSYTMEKFAELKHCWSPICFSPDGSMLAGTRISVAVLWSVSKRRKIATLYHAGGDSVCFSPDGRVLAIGSTSDSGGGTVELWSVDTRQRIATLRGNAKTPKGSDNNVNSICFSPDGSMLASGSDYTTVKLWSVDTRREIATLKGHTGSVTSVSFSLDGSMLASGSVYDTVKLWSVDTRQEIATLKGHTGSVNSICFSPDGNMLASASRDRTVKLWSVDTRQELAMLEGHAGWDQSVSFSSDGSILASGGGRTIRIWDLTEFMLLTEVETARANGDVDSLIRLLSEEFPQVRLATVKALSELEHPRAVPALQKLLKNETDTEIQAIAERIVTKLTPLYERFRRESPCELTTTLAFSDEYAVLPNNAIDAGERRGTLTLTVSNSGTGIGFDVKFAISCDNPDVTIVTIESLGDIEPNEKNTITLPLTTNLQAQDGVANILVETKEKRGFDAQKQNIIIPVRRLKAPKLEIAGLELNDKTLGNAVGNGNGIPENNETISIVAFIKNSGVGNAIGTKLDLVSINSGIEVLARSTDLGTIRPNQTVKGTLLFRIPRTYRVEAGSTLDYKVRVEDVRGADAAEGTKTVAMSAQQPILAYSIQAPTTLHNGRTAQFQITPKNRGTLASKGVNLKLSVQGATVTPASVLLGDIAANASVLAQPFTVTLPRTYKKQNLTLEVKLTQTDFVGLTKTATYPVELIAPDLILTDRFFDSSGDGKIEQGELVELEITVNNKGKLEALDTMLKVKTSKPLVRIKPESKSIGTLPENTTSDPMRFTLTIPRGVEAGAFPITLKVTQRDFPEVTKTLEYAIYEVGAATTVVEAKKPSETPQPEAVRGNQPPTILPNVKDNQTIYTPNYQLQVSVSDDQGLTSAQVRLNGPVIYDSQVDPSAADKLSASAGKLLSFTQPLTTLKEGVNELVISAIDNDNEKAEITIRLNYNPRAKVIAGLDNPSDVDVEIPKGKAQNQNAVALVIGIEKYQNVSVALYGDRDAIAFKGYLTALLGLNDANIILLTNERATLGGIKTALRKLENLVTPGQSDVFVFYSGHGAPTVDGKQAFLIPYDGDPNYPQDSGYPLMEFYDRLDKMKAQSVTVFVDACFSGTDKDNNLIIAAAKPLFMTIEGAGAYKNLEIFSSSTGEQISSCFNDKMHGMFTYFLLKGMRREADTNKDGTITLAEMEAYVKEQVSIQARRMGRQQEPMFTGKKERVLVRYEDGH